MKESGRGKKSKGNTGKMEQQKKKENETLGNR